MSCQIQSAFHEKKHVADMAFARIPLVWQGRHTQWCIKPLCSYGTFNTGLKHQRFRTAFSDSFFCFVKGAHLEFASNLHFGNL